MPTLIGYIQNKTGKTGDKLITYISLAEDTLMKYKENSQRLDNNTIIKYNNGVQDKEISWGELRKFMNENIKPDGSVNQLSRSLNDWSSSVPAGYFYVHETNPNEMSMAILEVIRNYENSDPIIDARAKAYLEKYHSSLNEQAIELDYYANTKLIDEMIDAFEEYLYPDLTPEQRRARIEQRLKGNTLFSENEDYRYTAYNVGSFRRE